MQEPNEKERVKDVITSEKRQRKYAVYEMYMAFDVISFIEDVPTSVKEINERQDKQM